MSHVAGPSCLELTFYLSFALPQCRKLELHGLEASRKLSSQESATGIVPVHIKSYCYTCRCNLVPGKSAQLMLQASSATPAAPAPVVCSLEEAGREKRRERRAGEGSFITDS